MSERNELQGRPGEQAAGRAGAMAWGTPLVLGLAVMALGVLAFIYVGVASVVSALWVGALVAVGGIFELASAFREHAHRRLRIASGILSIVVGAFVLVFPAAGVAAVGLLIAAWFFTSGLIRFVTSIADRYPRWGWDTVYGAIGVILGGILVAMWPLSSFLAVGVLVAVELIVRGAAMMGIALTIREFVRGARVPA